MLGIIENFTSFDPAISERVIRDTNLLQWMLNRIRVKAFDSNKQYCSELLAILLQNSRGILYLMIYIYTVYMFIK